MTEKETSGCYRSMAQCLLDAAERYVVKGQQCLADGNHAYADGCFLKAEKKRRQAAEFEVMWGRK